MDEAYTIGIRLALEDGVSTGIAAVSGEMARLDRAMVTGMAGLERFRALGAASAGPAAQAMREVPRTADEPGTETGPAMGGAGVRLPMALRAPAVEQIAGPALAVRALPVRALPMPALEVPDVRVRDLPVPDLRVPDLRAMSAPLPFARVPAEPPERGVAAPAMRPVVHIHVPATAPEFATRGASAPAGDVTSPFVAQAQRPAGPALAPSDLMPMPAREIPYRVAPMAPSPAPEMAGPFTPLEPAVASGLAAPMASAAPQGAAGGESGPSRGDVYLDGARMGRWVADRMAREARRPQGGSTGFDGRMGPAWPGTLQGV